MCVLKEKQKSYRSELTFRGNPFNGIYLNYSTQLSSLNDQNFCSPSQPQSSLTGSIAPSPLASRPWQCLDLESKHAFLRNVALIRNSVFALHRKGCSVWEAVAKPCLSLPFLLPPPPSVLLCARSLTAYFSEISRECKCPCLWSRAQSDSHVYHLKLKLAFSLFCHDFLNILLGNLLQQTPL